ncbi:MAG TPA: ankyrin repeat domain-containing protein [Armatimonadaceae bacterium]|nr:ankyrin repeat domain-containing protein [Armatimonadaceae bacterium]
MTPGPQESDLEWMLAALRLGAGSKTAFAAPRFGGWSGHYTAMHVAILHGRADVVRFLWQEYGPDNDALKLAVYYDRREIAELLVTLGAVVCHEYWNTLETALQRGHDELFHWLLERGVPVTGRAGQDTLRAACSLLREDVVRLLIDRGAEAEPPGSSLVGGVCNINHEKPQVGRIVRFLLDYGADPNGLLGNGDTPLITACRFQPVGPATAEIADTLLNAGADPNRRNLLGETALTVAVQGGYLPLVELLVRHGADVNARTAPVHTPLSLARARGRDAVTNFLRRNGATE